MSDSVGSFEIAGVTIEPGGSATISIPVSSFATGIPAELRARVLHGAKPGPRVFISAAVHGDEIIGTAIIRRLLDRLDPKAISGTVILVPSVNMFGFLTHSRYLPDRRDLNRSFPGGTKGSLAGQLANKFLTEIIGHCSLGIDIHSAAIHRYNLPQIRIDAGDPELLDLAMAFGAPVVIQSPLRPGSLRSVAGERGVKMLLMETGEALRFDRLSLHSGEKGVLRVLAKLGMIVCPEDCLGALPPARSKRSVWVRAPRGGVSRRRRKSGDHVEKGDVLADVSGMFGDNGEELVSPIAGLIIGHTNLPVVNQGDAMFHIAELVGDDDDMAAERILDEDELI